MDESAPFALEVHPRLTPGVLLPSFRTSEKKVAARRNLAAGEGLCPSPCTPSGCCAATSPVKGEATALSKEMGSEKAFFKDAVLETGQGLPPLRLYFTTWALMRLVEPLLPMGTPAVMTTVSPGSTTPSFLAESTHRENSRSVESTLPVR